MERRARVHAALGDPARLAVVDTLTLGDASPGEIARALDLPTNLVAHHVNVLHDAGLLTRVRSEGDRRRTYLRLEPDTLARLAAPVLAPVPRVVFVCTHNSARSQLAAAIWTGRVLQRLQPEIPAASAGTHPAARVHPRAVAVARRHGLHLDATGTAHITDVVHDTDLVVAVCDNAHEGLTRGVRPRLHWSVPAPADTDAAFEATFAELAGRIERLAPAVVPAR
ncbi:arsenate reductase/protein-tyrosine-phosphatase family protein [Dactylosporangium aurantiacum]|uniref:arsenate reductase/protein-tyrosine-phosphatase family protein n=1 Tax=Dactylosporangium aurantiacum TaxID=35754 RepID=UPI001FE1108A|nr:helix-turn-helix domain-containing protein [Dactylosporangium aurantiacum]MDG6103762.1 helix-turn-helix domain-containing protein [Dactylosporangium aurantiacum]